MIDHPLSGKHELKLSITLTLNMTMLLLTTITKLGQFFEWIIAESCECATVILLML